MNKARQGNSLNYYIDNNLSKFGYVMWMLYVYEIYPDGATNGYKLNWWHPIAIMFFVCVVLIASIIVLFNRDERIGLKEAWRDNKFHFGVDKYFRKNPHLIEFIPRSKKKRDIDEFMTKMSQ